MADESALAGLDWRNLGIAGGLLVLAAGLFVAELFVVSFGVLVVSSIAAAAGAIYYAFEAGTTAGWSFAVTTPVLAVGLVRWGVGRVRASRLLVAQDEVTAESGYHHRADAVGARPGAIGVMVTPARPSGRARFEGGECDVQVQGGVAETDTRVAVRRLDGPIVFVSPLPAETSEGAPDGATMHPGRQRT